MKKTQAAILAGGFGTRLRSMVHDRNKVAARVAGRPFIAFLIDELTQAGIDGIVICSGYKGQDLAERLSVNDYKTKLIFSQEQNPMGTAGALGHAAHLFSSDAVMVLNGDSHCDLDLRSMMQKHSSSGAAVTIAAVWVSDVRRYGGLEINDDGNVTAFREKQSNKRGGYINGGIYIIETALLETIPKNRKVSLETEMFPKWIHHGIHAFLSNGLFIDIGTPESFLLARSYFEKLDWSNSQTGEKTTSTIEE